MGTGKPNMESDFYLLMYHVIPRMCNANFINEWKF